MKIHFTMFGIEMSGGTKIILGHAHRLAEKGHKVTITTLGNKPKFRLFPFRVRVPITYLGDQFYQREGYPEPAIRALSQATPDCDVNIATFSLTAFAVHRSGKGKGFYYMQHFEPLFFSNNLYMERLVQGSYFLPLQKIVNSSWLKGQLRSKLQISTKEIPVLNSAIDLKLFHPMVKRDKERVVVICMVRPMSWKGFADAEAAMEQVRKIRPQVEFWVFCQPGSKLRPRFATRVFQTLSEKDLAKLYAEADILLSPSWYESSPLLVLEGLASGTVVITTPIGTEDIIFHRKNGWVVPPKEPQILGKAILHLVERPKLRRDLRRAGLRTVKQFSWEIANKKLERILQVGVNK